MKIDVHLIYADAVRIAERLGYRVVLDWIDGCGGGRYEAMASEWIMLDRGATIEDRLGQLLAVLEADQRILAVPLPARLVAAMSGQPRGMAA